MEITISQELAKILIGMETECYQVEGDCLAGRKVPDRGFLLFDVEAQPTIGQITMCTTNSGQVLAKVFIGRTISIRRDSVTFREEYIVQSWVNDQSRDKTLLVPHVRGVAVACFDPAGQLIWGPLSQNKAKNSLCV